MGVLFVEDNSKIFNELKQEALLMNKYPHFYCKFIGEKEGKKFYTLGCFFWKCLITISYENNKWYLTISNKYRKPSSRQVFIARCCLLPKESKFKVVEELIPGSNCISLIEISPKSPPGYYDRYFY